MRDHDVPFPFNIRRNVSGWKLLFLDGKRSSRSRALGGSESRRLSRQRPGHCAECHSPRNLLGGIIAAQRFAGGPNPEGEGWVPNITQKGLGGVEREGHRLFSGDRADPEATARRVDGRVIKNTSQLTPEDRVAMAEYLKSLPAVEGPPRPKKAAKSS